MMADRKGEKMREKAKLTNSRSGKHLSQQEIHVGEELKIAVGVAVDGFINNESEKELQFPSSLTANERAYVHRYCKDLSLATKSKGKGNKRFLTVYKVVEKSVAVCGKFSITKSSSNIINNLLQNFPVTSREKHEGQKLHKGIVNEQSKILARENRLVLGNAPHIPPEAKDSESKKTAAKLPIHDFKDEILEKLDSNQVVFIAGDTGSGKTTQVAQFILEKHHKGRSPCRIICTQPRRLSAISIAERVAAERGERVGQTVGYQVRLDSKLSHKTLLQFCTTGVLLRLLMVGHKCLSNITHIIVDEIHERDCLSDYLLISLRDLLKNYKKLKVILMSAALNVDLFTNYFGSCPFIHVSGISHDVKTFFLEDILKQTGYLSKGMRKMLQDDDLSLFKADEEDEKKSSTAAADVMKMVANKGNEEHCDEEQPKCEDGVSDEGSDVEVESETEVEETSKQDDKKIPEQQGEEEQEDEGLAKDDDELADEVERLDIESDMNDNEDLTDADEQIEEVDMSAEMDVSLAQAWLNGDDEAFDQIIHLIMNENVNIDYQHSETKMTSLIVAAARGNLTLTEQLVELGAKRDIQDPKNNRDALDWAHHFNQKHVVDYLKVLAQPGSNNSLSTLDDTSIEEDLTENDRRRLELYHKSFDDQRVDINLIIALLTHIFCNETIEGSVLVFLPGYDTILSLRDKLKQDKEFSKRSKYQILMLHSMLPSSNQHKVFSKPPKGVRKIIISTNIAETGVTIDDVVCVIDSGKVKEKSHDAISSVSTLRTVWISKASAIQRRGRAGRCMPGLCYHLFSQERFHHFQMYQDAEILRVPIHSLCLQTKMLAPFNVSITDYLSKAPEPPSNVIIRGSLRMLKSISAIDENEEMTDLGKLLVEFPIDPQFGKMVLIGMTLKCLDPSIIIACCSSFKEPFILPNIASQKSAASSAKLKLSSDSCSDQIAMLRAFQGWQRAKREGKEKTYCSRNYISPGTMEMVSGTRRQILGLLRNLGLVKSRGPGDIKDLNENSRNWSVIKAVIGASLYPNYIKVDKDNGMLVSEKEKKVNIHNSSILMARSEDKVQSTVSRANKLNSIISNLPLDWLVYEELSRLYYSVQIRSVSVLSPVAVALMAGSCLSYDIGSLRLRSNRDRKGRRSNDRRETFFQDSDDSDQEQTGDDVTATLKIDDWITFTGDDVTLYAIAMLRAKFLALFSKHIQIPSKQWNQADNEVVQAIADILIKEEQAVGLTNPATKDIEKRLAYERRYERHGHRQYVGRGGYGRSRGGRGDYLPPRSERRYRPPRDDVRSPPVNEHRHEQRRRSDNEEENDGEDSDRKVKARRPRSYFILKCNNEKNMTISFERNIWATTKSNEKRLDRAFNDCDEVLLIFSVQGSGRFQGVAKMVGGISDKFCEDFGSSNLGGVFEVEWIHQEDLPFQATQHLINPWNDNKKVQISRDAQEVEPGIGKSLVDLWDKSQEVDRDDHIQLSSPEEIARAVPADDAAPPEFYSPPDMYTEGEPQQQYVEEYQMYSPPPFSPQFIPDFQQVPAHYPPPPSMPYQQPYPVYAPTGNISPYHRQQEYFPFQYPSPRRGAPVEMYHRGGEHFQNVRPSHEKERSGYRS